MECRSYAFYVCAHWNNKTSQVFRQNGVIPTVTERSKIFWRTIKRWRTISTNSSTMSSHVPLQRFAWCIAGHVLRLLKPSLYYRLASIFRKANNAELKFSQNKAMNEAHWVTLQTAKLFENCRILQLVCITI